MKYLLFLFLLLLVACGGDPNTDCSIPTQDMTFQVRVTQVAGQTVKDEWMRTDDIVLTESFQHWLSGGEERYEQIQGPNLPPDCYLPGQKRCWRQEHFPLCRVPGAWLVIELTYYPATCPQGADQPCDVPPTRYLEILRAFPRL